MSEPKRVNMGPTTSTSKSRDAISANRYARPNALWQRSQLMTAIRLWRSGRSAAAPLFVCCAVIVAEYARTAGQTPQRRSCAKASGSVQHACAQDLSVCRVAPPFCYSRRTSCVASTHPPQPARRIRLLARLQPQLAQRHQLYRKRGSLPMLTVFDNLKPSVFDNKSERPFVAWPVVDDI